MVRRDKVQSFGWDVVESIPVLLPVILASFSCVVTVLLLKGRLTNSLVWPLGALTTILTIWLMWRQFPLNRPGSQKDKHLYDGLVLAGVLLWILFNLFFTAQSAFVTRDPGIYTITGKWLITHQQTNIKTPPITEYKNNLVNYSSGIWLPYNPDKTTLQPQGSHLLPALLGLAGRLFGVKAIYKLNVFFGGIALLAIYGFARQLTKPKWAAFAVAILGLSLPFIYFSRDTYTELLACIFAFGALTLVWLAQSGKGRQLVLWALAGLAAGAGVIGRPDGYFPTISIIFIIFVMLALAKKNEIRDRIYNGFAFILAAVIPIILGWLDLTRLSSSYYRGVHKEVKTQAALILFEILVGTIVAILCWRTNLTKYLDKRTKSWRSNTAAFLIILGFVLLVSRPIVLFSKAHVVNNLGSSWGTFVQPILHGATSPQQAWALSMEWIVWYVGLPILVLGFIGLAIAASKSLQQKNPLMLPSLILVGAASLVYGLSPKITPDQIWAIRRFLPVILPGLVVFAVYAIEIILDVLPKHSLRKLFVPLALVFIIMQPLIVSRPFLAMAEKANNQQAMDSFCKSIPQQSVVIWLASVNQLDAVQSTRAYCGVNSLGYIYGSDKPMGTVISLSQPELKKVAQEMTAQGKIPILAIHGSQKQYITPDWTGAFSQVANYNSLQLETPIYNPPREAVNIPDSIEIARINPDGSLSRVTSQ